ncbi:hypothetical protein ADUPG1_011966, partial [Aduncisulcus paluster]
MEDSLQPKGMNSSIKKPSIAISKIPSDSQNFQPRATSADVKSRSRESHSEKSSIFSSSSIPQLPNLSDTPSRSFKSHKSRIFSDSTRQSPFSSSSSSRAGSAFVRSRSSSTSQDSSTSGHHQVEYLQKLVASLEEELAESKKNESSAMKSLAESKKRQARLVHSLDHSPGQSDSIKIAQLTAEKEKAERNAERSALRCSNLSSTLEAAQIRIGELENEVRLVHSRIDQESQGRATAELSLVGRITVDEHHSRLREAISDATKEQKQKYEDRIGVLEEEIEKRKTEMLSFRDEVRNEDNARAIRLQKEIKLISKKQDETAHQVTVLEGENDELHARIRDLKDSLSVANGKVQALSESSGQNIDHLKEELEDITTDRERLRAEKDSLFLANSQLSTLSADMQQKIEIYEEEIKALQAHDPTAVVSTFQKRISELESQLGTTRSENHQLTQSLTESQQLARKAMNEKDKAISHAKEKHDEAIIEERKIAQVKIRSLETELRTRDKARELEKVDLMKMIQDIRSSLDETQRKYEKECDKTQSLSRSISDLTHKLDDQTIQLGESDVSSERLNKVIIEMNERISNLSQKLKDKDRETKAAVEKAKLLDTEMRKRTQAFVELEREMKKQSEEFETLQEKHSRLSHTHRTLQSELSQSEANGHMSQAKIHKSHSMKLMEMSSSHTVEISQKDKYITIVEKKAQDLREELKAQAKHSDGILRVTQERIAELEAIEQQGKKRIEDLERELDKYSSQVRQGHAKEQELEEEKSALLLTHDQELDSFRQLASSEKKALQKKLDRQIED